MLFSLSFFLSLFLSSTLPFIPSIYRLPYFAFLSFLYLPSLHLLGGLPLPRLGNTPVPVEVIDWPIDRFVSFCLFSASAQGKGDQISASPRSHHKPSSAFHLTSLPSTRTGTLNTPRRDQGKREQHTKRSFSIPPNNGITTGSITVTAATAEPGGWRQNNTRTSW